MMSCPFPINSLGDINQFLLRKSNSIRLTYVRLKLEIGLSLSVCKQNSVPIVNCKSVENYSFFSAFSRNTTNLYSQNRHATSRRHVYTILTPETPLLHSKTGVYRGIHYFFFISAHNIDYGYSLEPPHQGGSNEYPQCMF